MASLDPSRRPPDSNPRSTSSAYYRGPDLRAVVVGLRASRSPPPTCRSKPRNRDTAVKQMPYESGMDPIGAARMQFDVKFYLIAILFLVFDVELLFLYPWAVVAYRDGGDAAWRAAFGPVVFSEMLVFIATLVVAYVYAWRKGVFQWR